MEVSNARDTAVETCDSCLQTQTDFTSKDVDEGTLLCVFMQGVYVHAIQGSTSCLHNTVCEVFVQYKLLYSVSCICCLMCWQIIISINYCNCFSLYLS